MLLCDLATTDGLVSWCATHEQQHVTAQSCYKCALERVEMSCQLRSIDYFLVSIMD